MVDFEKQKSARSEEMMFSWSSWIVFTVLLEVSEYKAAVCLPGVADS